MHSSISTEQCHSLKLCSFLLACTSILLLLTLSAAQAQVTPGADLEFNAALNPNDGTDFWYPNIDTLPFAPTVQNPLDTSVPREYVFFGQNQSFTSVNDPSFPGIAGSYSKGGTGRARNDGVTGPGNVDTPHGWAQNINDPDGGQTGPWEQDGTFEIWFNPSSLSGGEQAILEWGGGGRGAYFSLVSDEISFFVNGNNNALAQSKITSTGWHQMVGTYHNLQSGATGDDYISLFLDGVLVDDTSATPTTITRWSGGNAWGVGEIGVSNLPLDTERASDGPLTLGANSDPINRLGLDGDVAIVRYYNDQILTPAEVLANFNAVAAIGVAGDADGDGDVDGADFLEYQRTDPSQISTWESNYPFPLAAISAVAVPEPGACLLMFCGAMLYTIAGRRSSH